MFEIVFDAKMKKTQAVVNCSVGTNGFGMLEWREFGGERVKDLFDKKEIVFDLRGLKNQEETAYNIAFGLTLGAYSFDKYENKKDNEYFALEKVSFCSDLKEINRKNYNKYVAVADAIRYCRDLVSEPEEKFSNEDFAADVRRLEYLGLKTEESKGNISVRWKGKEGKKDDLVLVGSGRNAAALIVSALKSVGLQNVEKNVTGFFRFDEKIPKIKDALKVVAESSRSEAIAFGDRKLAEAGKRTGEFVLFSDGSEKVLDVSARVFEKSGSALYPKGASGFGVMLLDEYIKEL